MVKSILTLIYPEWNRFTSLTSKIPAPHYFSITETAISMSLSLPPQYLGTAPTGHPIPRTKLCETLHSLNDCLILKCNRKTRVSTAAGITLCQHPPTGALCTNHKTCYLNWAPSALREGQGEWCVTVRVTWTSSDNPNDRALTAQYDEQVPTVVQTYRIFSQGSWSTAPWCQWEWGVLPLTIIY